MYNLDEKLRAAIGECGLIVPEKASLKYFNGEQPFQLMIYEGNIEFEKDSYRIVWVEKWIFDTERTEELDVAETVFFESWKI